MNPALPRRWQAAVLSGAALAFIVKILLALKTYGTNDVYAWERFAHWSALFGSGLYDADAAFNHPPSMIHVLAALSWLAKATGVFFPFWLRVPAIVADLGILWLVYRIFESRLDEPAVRWGLLVLAVSPASILISGFHGNTDPVVMFFVLLAVWLSQRGASEWQSGAAFGAAMCVKILPVIVLPVFFFSRVGLRRKAMFLVSAGVVILIAWSPYIFRDPAGIYRQVFGYQSIYGHWGLTWLVYYLPFVRDSWQVALQHYGTWVTLAIITVAAWLLNRRPERFSVYMQTGAALFFFLCVASGFGVQYLVWLAPWIVGMGIVPSLFFTLASGAFLLAVYNFWSGGFPWYLADSNYVGDFVPHLDYLLTVAWISVIVLALAVWKRQTWYPSRPVGILLAVCAIPLIAWPLWKQVIRTDVRTYPPETDRAALTSIRANEYAMLSQVYYKMGRYTDALNAARTALQLAPEDETANAALAEAQNRLR